ncbi:UNVERIFIED_CONTAM: hypothetical protein K2H54_001877 [Gekko kuhli]
MKEWRDYLVIKEDEEENEVEQRLSVLEKAQGRFHRDLEELSRVFYDPVIQPLLKTFRKRMAPASKLSPSTSADGIQVAPMEIDNSMPVTDASVHPQPPLNVSSNSKSASLSPEQPEKPNDLMLPWDCDPMDDSYFLIFGNLSYREQQDVIVRLENTVQRLRAYNSFSPKPTTLPFKKTGSIIGSFSSIQAPLSPPNEDRLAISSPGHIPSVPSDPLSFPSAPESLPGINGCILQDSHKRLDNVAPNLNVAVEIPASRQPEGNSRDNLGRLPCKTTGGQMAPGGLPVNGCIFLDPEDNLNKIEQGV